MDKLLLAILASAGAAFAALAPAGADTTDMRVTNSDAANAVQDRRLVAANASACRIEMHWKYDYAGKPYLKKVRVCA